MARSSEGAEGVPFIPAGVGRDWALEDTHLPHEKRGVRQRLGDYLIALNGAGKPVSATVNNQSQGSLGYGPR